MVVVTGAEEGGACNGEAVVDGGVCEPMSKAGGHVREGQDGGQRGRLSTFADEMDCND